MHNTESSIVYKWSVRRSNAVILTNKAIFMRTCIISYLILLTLRCVSIAQYTYRVESSDKAYITGSNSDEQFVNIPESIDGYVVIGIDRLDGLTNAISINIPKTVHYIGGYALYDCLKLHDIYVSSDSEFYESIDGVLFSKSGLSLVLYPPARTNLYIVPNCTTNICDYAFDNCALASLVVGSNVIHIGVQAFMECRNLTNVIFSDSVRNIGTYAFAASGLKHLFIPSGITNLTEGFYNCDSLTDVVIADGIKEIGNQAFIGCDALTNIVLGANLEIIGTWAFYMCSKLEHIIIPERVTTIERDAFASSPLLTNIYFNGDCPTYVSASAFQSDVLLHYRFNKSGWHAADLGFSTTLWRAKIETDSICLAENELRFYYNGPPNDTAIVQISTNYAKNWINVHTNILSSASSEFTDINYPNNKSCFYRIVLYYQ